MQMSRLLLHSLPSSITHSQLSQMFTNFNAVSAVGLFHDHSNKLTGYVDFMDARQAENARAAFDGWSGFGEPLQVVYDSQGTAESSAKRSRAAFDDQSNGHLMKQPRGLDSMAAGAYYGSNATDGSIGQQPGYGTSLNTYTPAAGTNGLHPQHQAPQPAPYTQSAAPPGALPQARPAAPLGGTHPSVSGYPTNAGVQAAPAYNAQPPPGQYSHTPSRPIQLATQLPLAGQQPYIPGMQPGPTPLPGPRPPSVPPMGMPGALPPARPPPGGPAPLPGAGAMPSYIPRPAVPGPRPPPVPPPMPAPLLPPNAANILHIDILPNEITKREVAHIFRQYDGYLATRIVQRDSTRRSGDKITMAFVEYETVQQATTVMHRLQGYVLDPEDERSIQLKLSYAKRHSKPHMLHAGKQ